ncbi:O-antigen ligase family protein [Paenibacillus sp. HJGM_3]|uniref:O-antigen ligase family protein n=1 Tax=Paenibacillus sp. HJGM_3 TaxID=3379816 RepID=UPI00385DC4C8
MNHKVNAWAVGLFVWIGACLQGYFYETGYLVMTGIAAAIALIVVWRRKTIPFHPMYHLPIFLLVALYGGSILYALDGEAALLEAMKVTSLIPLSILTLTIPDVQRPGIYKAWVWSGVFVAVLGILFHMDRKGRLESTFEYANALAIYLLVALFLAIFLYLKFKGKTYFVLMAILSSGLLLTMSRSVWVLWGMALLIGLMMFREARARPVLSGVAVAHISGYLIAAAVRTDFLFWWQRVKSIQPETSEFRIRLVYWKDSLSIVRDFWLGGTGGGGWSVLLTQYRSQLYYVRYVHNHYIQLALDAGIIGLIVFLLAIAAFYWTGLRQIRSKGASQESVFWMKAAMLLAGVMLLHAGFDFDLEFPLLLGLLFFVMSAPYATGKKEIAKPIWSKAKMRVAVPLATVVTVPVVAFMLWLGAGYGFKERAIQLADMKEWEQAQASFERSSAMIPWSHTIHYESAKAWVRQSNETGDLRSLELASEELSQAMRRVPKEDLYQSLRIDINKALAK